MPRGKYYAVPFIALLLFGVSALLPADVFAKSNRYALPGHGAIDVAVPKSWVDSIHQPRGELPPTIVFRTPDTSKFQVLITPIWHANKKSDDARVRSAKSIVERSAGKAASSAVERDLPVRAFSGRSGKGYYFSATDGNPEPGGYRYLTQGVIVIDDLTVTFTILTNSGAGDAAADAMQMIKEIRRIRS